MKSYFLAILALVCFITTAQAQDSSKSNDFNFSPLVMTGEAQVENVIDPLRVQLLDGRIIQLSSLDVPDLTPYDTGDIGMAAMDLLKETLVKKTVKIYQSKDVSKGRTNRMGYHIAHLVEKNSGEWIQQKLLGEGLARVRPSSINTALSAEMMKVENTARKDSKGLWALPDYAVLTADTAGGGMNGWAIVEGTIRATGMSQNLVFLNFGENWKSDFTVGIPAALRRKMSNAGENPMEFAHKRVRVRGWIEDYNGPYIELMAYAWIEILPADSEEATLAE